MQSHTDTRTSDESSLQSSLTVAELAQAPDLHLQVVAGRTGLSRVIEAVYIGDLDDPTRWMVQGSVVLTTGPRLEEDPESGAELVRLLKRSGMVGVGVAIMPNVRIIPEVMLAAGDEQGLPVLRVPEETPFRLVTSYVFNALASRDMHRLRRSVAMQQHLVDALLDERSVEALVRRLAELLDADAAVLDRNGHLLARWSGHRWSAEDEALVARAWREYGLLVQRGAPRSFFELDERYVGFREVRRSGRVEQLLLVAHPSGRLISELADASLSFAQRLLEVELGSAHASADLRRRDAFRSARAPPASARQPGRTRRAPSVPRHRAERAVAGGRARCGNADPRSVGAGPAAAGGARQLGFGDCRRPAGGARRSVPFPSRRRPRARALSLDRGGGRHRGGPDVLPRDRRGSAHSDEPFGRGARRLRRDDGCRACCPMLPDRRYSRCGVGNLQGSRKRASRCSKTWGAGTWLLTASPRRCCAA